MSKIVYANLTGHVTPDVFLNKGDEWPADHPLVKARPELFDAPEEPEPPVEHDKHEHVSASELQKPKRGRPRSAEK